MPGSITFSWTAATDPYSTDNTIGYIVIRNTANVFPANPSDGYTYSIGDNIGPATVVGIINNSSIATFTDNTVMNGNKYYYRVYAFRYTTDNLNGNSYNTARGRAYNETNFVFVNYPFSSALPVELIDWSANKVQQHVQLLWKTASEINNDYFIVEKSTDGNNFETLEIVKGNGTTQQVHTYELPDYNPRNGINYYRLKQIDFNGSVNLLPVIAVNFESQNAFNVTLLGNPIKENMNVQIIASGTSVCHLKLFNMQGQVIKQEEWNLKSGVNFFQSSLTTIAKGAYFLKLETESNKANLKIIKE